MTEPAADSNEPSTAPAGRVDSAESALERALDETVMNAFLGEDATRDEPGVVGDEALAEANDSLAPTDQALADDEVDASYQARSFDDDALQPDSARSGVEDSPLSLSYPHSHPFRTCLVGPKRRHRPVTIAAPISVTSEDTAISTVSPNEPGVDDEDDEEEYADSEPLGYESASDPAEQAEPVGAGSGAGGWTIPLLCAGIGLIACCLLIPLADSNRRLAYERLRLRQDLESIQTQVAVNDGFLRRVHDDPSLSERLAQRQMKTIREGTRVLELDPAGAGGNTDTSPFQIVAVQPPPPLPEYRPVGGTIARLCYRPRTRLYLTGAGLMMMAAGLVLGVTPRRS